MKTRRFAYIAMAVVCAAIGAMAGITGGSAATTHHKARRASTDSTQPTGPGMGPGPGPGMPAIHSVSVVPNKEGTGFDTLTTDSGIVQSVSGQQLTITEGTKSLTYKTVTLSIPASATVQRDGKTAQLSELQSGDHVMVNENSDGTSTVTAGDSSYKPAGGPGGPGPGGPPPGQGQGTPPSSSSGG